MRFLSFNCVATSPNELPFSIVKIMEESFESTGAVALLNISAPAIKAPLRNAIIAKEIRTYLRPGSQSDEAFMKGKITPETALSQGLITKSVTSK